MRRPKFTGKALMFREVGNDTIRVAVQTKIGSDIDTIAIIDVTGATDEATAMDLAIEKAMFPTLGKPGIRFKILGSVSA